jgi:hypothetical protein
VHEIRKMKTCEICKLEIEGESISKFGYYFHKEVCWKQFKKLLRKAQKGGVVGMKPEINGSM